MKRCIVFIALLILFGCDKDRLYEKDYDFKDRTWIVKEIPSFEFVISDSAQLYNIYYRVRNSNDYPYARIFIKYNLIGPSNNSISGNLVSNFLFDQKSGVPLGSSGIGDKFDNQFLLLAKQKFKELGSYKVTMEQFMRTDTLAGIEAVGLRVERTE